MESQKYLQTISQHLYNLKKIVDVYFTQPITIDKKLGKMFSEEKDKLSKLLKTPIKQTDISDPNLSLENGLLYSAGDTENSRKQIEKARDYLSASLDKVQEMRRYKSEPTTGIEEGELKEYLNFLLTKKNPNSKNDIQKISDDPILQEAGFLNLRKGGAICYKNDIIEMRTGLKTLCEIFINRPDQLINRDDIKDELGTTSKKSKTTIAKYISELNLILKPYFNKKPLTNSKKEGWIFHP